MSILFSLIKDIFNRTPDSDEVSAIRRLEDIYEQPSLNDTLAQYREAVAKNPNSADALFFLGAACELQNPDEAIDCYRKAIALDPQNYPARISLLSHQQNRCEWDSLKPAIHKIRKVVRESAITAKNHLSPFIFLTLPGTTAAEQKRCAKKYTLIEFPQDRLATLRHKLAFDFNRPSNTKLRLGYLSADFHDHATARLMAEIFEHHDRSRFHITAYSYGPNDKSMMRKRLEKAFDDFVDISEDSYEAAAIKIYADQTDILIDLKGYTLGSKSGILALRPAPIQVNYLGYPGTMGADFIDYLIADQFIIPPEQLKNYTEKVVCLPDCYQPTDQTRQRLPAPTRKECGLPEEGFIFCCFNQTYKITAEVFDVWCRLLKAVPESHLWFLGSNSYAANNLKREAENRGINPERLIVAPRIEPEMHLARLQCADLFLDTLPYNAHTTCSDALWMGLPVVTCAGETFPSRVAGSLLTAIGVPELITYNLDDYYRLALELATDKQKLAAIRNKIIANRDTAPLFDSKRFTRNLENAYMHMMHEHSAKTIPANI